MSEKVVRLADAQSESDFIVELSKRIARAEYDRARHYKKIIDCYRFTLPWRHWPDSNVIQDEELIDDLFDSIGMTVLEDFSADMLNTFTPMKANWVDIKPARSMKLNSADSAQLKDKLAEYTEVLFEEMRRSNLYQALEESYNDLGIGTMALLVDDIHPSEPIFCEAIPAGDLLLDRGPRGEIDGRFRRRRVRNDQFAILWPDIPKDKLPPYMPGDQTEGLVTEGVYRDWSDKGTETWQYVVFTGGASIPSTMSVSSNSGTLLLHKTFKGEGSCPYVTARWSRDTMTAWGVGPTYRSIPDIKTVNHIKYLTLKNMDKIVDPPFTYEDDGVVNFDQGIEPGVGIPKAMGSAEFQILESKGRFDVSALSLEDLKSDIKRAHYQDRPEQMGKTPPSATQWADEAAERARRMGTPATNLVIELQYPIIKRFAYLLNRRGVLPKIALNGKKVILEPVSPLLRAQEQETVVRIQRFLQIVAATFGPEMLNLIVDQFKVAEKIADKLGVPPELVRTQAQMAQAAQAISQATAQLPQNFGKVSRNPEAPATPPTATPIG